MAFYCSQPHQIFKHSTVSGMAGPPCLNAMLLKVYLNQKYIITLTSNGICTSNGFLCKLQLIAFKILFCSWCKKKMLVNFVKYSHLRMKYDNMYVVIFKLDQVVNNDSKIKIQTVYFFKLKLLLIEVKTITDNHTIFSQLSKQNLNSILGII